jgi:peptidoglycan/LPS O-acetylase OafA/YrhL
MATVPSPSREDNNNFGFLRLFLSILVILSHCPEALDGNRSRELLTRIFGSVSFGELAVDGFFLISGFLIVKSLLQSKSYPEYLLKRLLRIYPGFCVAFGVSLLIGLLAGGKMGTAHNGCLNVIRALSLHTPQMSGAFAGVANSALNVPMWSVSYEFRCYILVVVLAVLGIIKNRRFYLLITIALLLGLLSQWECRLPPQMEAVFGNVRKSIRLCAAFCCGGAFYLFRDRISYTRNAAIAATAVLLPLMFICRVAETALLILGGYLLFCFAFKVKSQKLNRIGREVDLSYGIYLYAWPIQNLLIWYYRSNISPTLLFAITTTMASAMAYASWSLVEAPFLRLKERCAFFRRRMPTETPLSS